MDMAKEIFPYPLIASIVQLGPIVPRPYHQPELAGEGQVRQVVHLHGGCGLIKHIVDVTSNLKQEHDRANCYNYFFEWF
jgi:hypothetical protein